ncbi:unnamed protein product [Effrenium voratum]|nr:unnamed protein product [Effrenium voratum]
MTKVSLLLLPQSATSLCNQHSAHQVSPRAWVSGSSTQIASAVHTTQTAAYFSGMSRSRSRSAGREMDEVSGESKASGDFWRLQLEAVYARRNPAKLGKIPELLQKYAGQEAVLYAKVCRTYDLNPQKFHTEPDAWLEYDLPDRGTYIRAADSTAEEQFEVLS